MKTCIVLFVIGILLSTSLMSQSNNSPIVLTKDNHITFTGAVDDSSVAKAQVKLGQLAARVSQNATIYIVIDSPGGSVAAGNLFIDYANSLPQTIKPICIFCASMGYHMFQSFDERIVFSSSTLMSHRASLGGLQGQVPGEFESRLNWIKGVLEIMDTNVAKRVGLSKEAYQKLIYDELWMGGVLAVQMKHADRIAKIKCSNELITGTREETFRTFFGPVTATFSNCPLISGFVDVKLGKETKFRSEEEAKLYIKKTQRNVLWNF